MCEILFHKRMQNNNTSWTFRKNKHLQHGDKLLICGSVTQLGNWDIQQSIPMKWTENNNWEATLDLPTTTIQYKFITEDSEGNRTWEPTSNRKLDLTLEKLQKKQLTLMSYNVRMDTDSDKEFAWKYRKDHAVETLLEQFPSIIGVQEALKHQKIELCDSLYDYYDYIGVARDLEEGEECGIFYLRHRFQVIEHGFVWFNETKTPGKVGFGAKLPRYMTYLAMLDTFSNQKFIVVNTHLDHESSLSQSISVKIIITTLLEVSAKHKIQNLFVMGDFNIDESDLSLRPLFESGLKFSSARFTSKVSDRFPTFHHYKGEQMMQKIKEGKKEQWYTIDHIFYSGKSVVPHEFKTVVTGKPYMSDHYPVQGVFTLE